MVIGEGKNMPAALIQPSFDQAKVWLDEQGIAYKNDLESLSENEHLIAQINKEIRIHDPKFGKWEQVKVIRLTPDIWSVEEGLLTPTMKVKRKAVLEKYSDLVEDIYS